MREEIRALQQRLGLTVVYVTHDQSEALAVSDKIVVMRNAEIAQAGTPADSTPAGLGLRRHLHGRGEPHPRPRRGRLRRGRARRRSTRCASNCPIVASHRARPMWWSAPKPSDRRGRQGDALAATVSRATYMGSHTEYYLSTPVGDLFALAPDRSTAACG
jgi:iron(III) transport system ATP-binding protein